ncbi:MAG: SDR family NAD(P)-dependent oxidoreductase [Alphaproteobacteria bacterium]|nr:SDR family NAD(P)-dependent oxidoreductase [Alphaproteobacteria bacterium]
MSERDDLVLKALSAAELLERVVEDRSILASLDADLRKRLLMAAGRASKPTKKERKKLERAHRSRDQRQRREDQRALLAKTGIRQLRENPIFQTPRAGGPGDLPPPIGATLEERVCYCCRRSYREVHFFYDQMCLDCGDLNYRKRHPEADLAGRVALVTGARVKIGFQAAVMLLRAGCRVIVTTRFPRDAARRYAALDDFADWSDRLEVVGIDLRQVPAVEGLCRDLLARLDRLDFIINNACQTVRRPPGFYDHLMEGERAPDALTAEARAVLAPSGTSSAELSQVALLPDDTTSAHLFPAGVLDADLQQVDLREVNSWRLGLSEVPTLELLEVQLVNAVAPFVLNARLKPLMRLPTRDAHIVNVSAMEGQFYRIFKSSKHPHTNMAKAALNMLTRTSALEYIEDGIHMNSVDTGWVTDEDPVHHAERKREEHGFHPPLDIVDGAARIVDPIFAGIATGEHVWGQFLKDYRPTDW